MATTVSKLAKPHQLKLFFSNRYCRAQIVRSADGHVIADACSWEKGAKEALESTSDKVSVCMRTRTRTASAITSRCQHATCAAAEYCDAHGRFSKYICQSTYSALPHRCRSQLQRLASCWRSKQRRQPSQQSRGLASRGSATTARLLRCYRYAMPASSLQWTFNPTYKQLAGACCSCSDQLGWP